jgi:Ser/Thr protein kinase RdoA (MazF antagonist)
VPATLFERVPGGPVVERDWAPSLFEQIGELMARMHGVSIDYHRGHRSRPAPHRPHWHENEPHARFRESVSVEDWALCREWDRLDQVLRALPATKQCYGLVHADIHRGNFFVHEGRIYLFDFDDCCIQWFASDLANTIYYALWDRRFEPIADRSSFAQEFASHLLAGYRRHRALGDDEIAWIPDLLEYRELCVYGFSRRRWGLEPVEAEVRARCDHVRKRVARGEPVARLDLDAL